MISESYENVLNSDNPDNKLEFFWLTFKDSIKNYLTEKELEEINDLSNQLNNLQKDKEYEKIENYIKLHIEKIGYSMIAKNDLYRICHLENNIRRWNKLTNKEIYSFNNTFYCLLLIYINLSKKKADKDSVVQVLDCIIKFSLDNTNKNLLNQLMNLLIKNKMYGNIDKLRNVLDINDFIDYDKCDDKITKTYIDSTRSHKLEKYLREF